METVNFSYLHSERKRFIKTNSKKDHVVLSGKNNILLSAPHGVSQVRLGKPKAREIGSLTTALYLQSETNSFLIAKTKNNFDDANFDKKCEYRKTLKKVIEENNIKYVVDLHGLAKTRDCDINLGTHLGFNTSKNPKLLEDLIKQFEKNGFVVCVDQPFMAGSRTISGYSKTLFPQIWSVQIEINCDITNKRKNFEKYKKLLSVLKKWINSVSKAK